MKELIAHESDKTIQSYIFDKLSVRKKSLFTHASRIPAFYGVVRNKNGEPECLGK